MPELIVPMHLDALVVNDSVIKRDTFRWWNFNYQGLNQFKSPEPEAGDRMVGGQKEGIYLHWTLPRALRHGSQNPQTGSIEFPLVPNRWLIVRLAGSGPRRACGWVLESDCPYSGQVLSVGVEQTSMYLVDANIIKMWQNSGDPFRNTVNLDPGSHQTQVANIGIPFPLEQGWQERAADTMFLTAVAPANPAFSIYYPHNTGVFSFYDDLAGLDKDLLSYLVLGWYSDPGRDIMAGWQKAPASPDPYFDLLDRLQWNIVGTAAEKAATSFYQGMSLDVDWDRHGGAPGNDPLQDIRDHGKLNVAIGNTTIDAFTALIGQQVKARGYDPQITGMLQAFQYDLLPLLNQVNGEDLLKLKIHREWFNSKPGGYRWNIVPREAKEDRPADLRPAESQWLSLLNQAQSSLDAGLRDLCARQWLLNATWWKRGLDPDSMWPQSPPGVSNRLLERELDPANPDGITGQVIREINRVNALYGQVPRPVKGGGYDPQKAFQQGIEDFARQKGLDDGKILKAAAAPRFWQSSNPVVIISGVEPSPSAYADENLQVRLADQLVNGFTFDSRQVDAGTVEKAVPMPGGLAGLPALVPALIEEFFLLDPGGAGSIASLLGCSADELARFIGDHDPRNFQGLLPDFGLQAWSQPWNPMYMEWKIGYAYIPYRTGPQYNWTFDGCDYYFSPGAGRPAAENREAGGIAMLSPHAQTVFGSRLADFIRKYGSEAKLQDLYNCIGEVYQWKFLAQELNGLNQLLSLRDPRAYRRPSPQDLIGDGAVRVPVAALTGCQETDSSAGYALPGPYQGQVNDVPYLPNGPVIPFHGMRQGQFYFKELFLYDKFGRMLHIIQSGSSSGLFDAKNFPLIRDEALYADPGIIKDINSVAQLPPRLLQHARLSFELVDGKSAGEISGPDLNANPVCGWLIPNHLDKSILIYAPDGQSLGEFRLVENEAGIKTAEWQAPPHSAIRSIDDLEAAAPQVRHWLEADPVREARNFEAFLQAVDEALWTVDSPDSRRDRDLPVLIGRPLALIRACLQFELDGPPIGDTGWAATFNPPEPDFVNESFAVRLGDQATREEGLIGYFVEENYDVFNSVAAPPADQAYIRQIGPVGRKGDGNYLRLQFNPGSAVVLTLLLDPRAGVHALTGLLPVKRLDVPAAFIDGPLRRIEVGFHVGPMLTGMQATPSQGEAAPQFGQAVGYPFPAGQNGTWSWWEADADSGQWKGYDLLNTASAVQLPGGPASLREGILQLLTDIKRDE